MTTGGSAAGRELGPRDATFLEVAVEVLRGGRRLRFRAAGMSMSPSIRDGEAVTVAPVLPSEIRSGDIVLFEAGRGVTAHRVVRLIRGSGDTPVLITRGDASASYDEPVEASGVLGRVVAVERDGRTVDLSGPLARLLGAGRARLVHLARRLRGFPH